MESAPSQNPIDIQNRFREAVQYYWDTRRSQQAKQKLQSKITDAGLRSAVTGGGHMAKLELLLSDLLCEAGLQRESIRTRYALELPGYFRPEKKWDLVVIADNQLIAAMEFKSQAGPSFGNNVNNRAEEAIGSATDIWTAYREGRLGRRKGFKPLLGYFFLLEDCSKVHKPVSNEEPHFQVDPAFKGASYCKRYCLLCKRLLMERLYDSACLTLSTNENKTRLSHPSADLSFQVFIAALKAQAARWIALTQTIKHMRKE
jgi:hypothetical protein